ncbi:MAG TPA: hypothetical protein VKI20_08010 [Acidimicrobiales bacterium]|nr:hypothetical protein [Acidimicrobiales bacterium]
MPSRINESPRDRVTFVEDAGLGRLSAVSILAGTLAGYGAFAVLLLLAAVIASASGKDPGSFTAHEWRTGGAVAGAVVAVLMLASYLLGGYTAGRMARRSGAAHGAMVFATGVIVAVGMGALIRFEADTSTLTAGLHDLGIPTTWGVWREVATVAGIAALAAMAAGGILGGMLGERWHGKLVRRAADPSIGPEAEARAAAAVREEDADRFHRAAMSRAERSSAVTGGQEPVLKAAKEEEEARA